MNKIKYLLASLFLSAGLFTANAQTWTDGRIDAYTQDNPHFGNPVVTSGSIIDLGNGYLLISFQVTGIGSWDCYEQCTGFQTRYLGSGRATPNGQVFSYVVNASDYVGCYLTLYNVHGWSGTPL